MMDTDTVARYIAILRQGETADENSNEDVDTEPKIETIQPLAADCGHDDALIQTRAVKRRILESENRWNADKIKCSNDIERELHDAGWRVQLLETVYANEKSKVAAARGDMQFLVSSLNLKKKVPSLTPYCVSTNIHEAWEITERIAKEEFSRLHPVPEGSVQFGNEHKNKLSEFDMRKNHPWAWKVLNEAKHFYWPFPISQSFD